MPIPPSAVRHEGPSKQYISSQQRRMARLRKPPVDKQGYELPLFSAASFPFGSCSRNPVYEPVLPPEMRVHHEERGFRILPAPVRQGDFEEQISYTNLL